MSTLTEIADALTTRLKTIPALDQNVINVVRRPATYPAAIITPAAIPEYDDSLATGGGRLNIAVTVLVGTTEAEQQMSLFPFVDWEGASSIPAAIQAQRDLGLGDVDARVDSTEPAGLVELPDGSVAYGVALNVLVFAGG